MRATQWRQGLIVGGLLAGAFGLISLIGGLTGKMKIAATEARNTKKQYEALEERRVALEANLVALATERGQDAAVRTSFGVARPGEEVIVVVPPDEHKASTSTPLWWERFLDWF